MTIRSLMQGESQFGLGIFRLQVAYGRADLCQRKQELYAALAGQLRRFAR